jgi:hypothetical protein
VIALTPMVDGLAAARHAMAFHGADETLRWTATAVRGRIAALRGAPAVTIPVVGKPGDVAALTVEGCYEGYLSIAGPTWVNEIDAGIAFELARMRQPRGAGPLPCPALVQIADFDRSAPPRAAAKAAFRVRAQVRHYPCDHFDVWPRPGLVRRRRRPPGALPHPGPGARLTGERAQVARNRISSRSYSRPGCSAARCACTRRTSSSSSAPVIVVPQGQVSRVFMGPPRRHGTTPA